MADIRRSNDLVLAVGEFCFILDGTKGHISTYVGPSKTSLSETDSPVIWDEKNRRFAKVDMDRAIQAYSYVPEGSYVVLANPAKDGENPKSGQANGMIELQMGKKVNLAGPTSFALFPQQTAQVIPGHQLRSNQYLVVRVYNDEAARENWKKTIVKLQTAKADLANLKSEDTAEETNQNSILDVVAEEIVLGKLFVIRGTDVSFYIPPTGVEVLQNESGEYVQDAVTLEQLEYTILLDENGQKRFERGPAVIFPEPTERFLLGKNGEKKFRALELNDISGIHLKVIESYKEGDRIFKVGEELFITGKDQSIYFPRHEHAIIKYGENEKHYAIAIPAGEGRYVLNRLTGKINLVKGPNMYLPDPRCEVIVRRILDTKKVGLWFPGNSKALEVNQRLMEESGGQDYLDYGVLAASISPSVTSSGAYLSYSNPYSNTTFGRSASPAKFAGDEIKRGQTYTPPRTITLDNKYDGAVLIDVWTGYAVLITSKTGERRVIIGPKTVLLEYDETLMPVQLSTGKPKTAETLYETVYLRVLNNLVSDIVCVETKDLVSVAVKLSYRINFEGDPNKWFNIENYVKYVTDHCRSKLRNVVKKYGIEEFYSNGIDLIRDTVLGISQEGKSRPGMVFQENGVKIYDVEVLGIEIRDNKIAGLLAQSQHSTVEKALAIVAESQNLSYAERSEKIKQEIAKIRAETFNVELGLKVHQIERELEVRLNSIKADADESTAKLDAEKAQQNILNEQSTQSLERDRLRDLQEIDRQKQHLELRIKELSEQAKAMVEKSKAITPDLIASLQAFSDAHLIEKVSTAMAPLSILGGQSVADVLSKLLKGTSLESAATKLLNSHDNS